jgi:Na+-translocating ferredoxin:NAD+ oxidoreductase RNF subunit RnfB
MNNEDMIYRDLQKHLDELPIGFPPTESGVEIRVLKHLFTPEEAKLATQLSMLPEPLSDIYEHVKDTGISMEKLEQALESIALKGSIWREVKDGVTHYSNIMLVIGMFEFHVERLTEEFLKDLDQYFDEAFDEELYRTKIPQLRTIPIEKSITIQHNVSAYDDVTTIIEDCDGKIAVANCICRQEKDIKGESCNHTDLRETCFLFGDAAEHYLHLEIARLISKGEALDILQKAQEAGLVLQPENTQRPMVICCCCGDCCGILGIVKKYPRPVELFASNYYSEVDSELCTGCETCADICQLEAITMVDSIATVNLERCIGCGNCVANCLDSAITLRKKEEELIPAPNTISLYGNILAKKLA